MSRVTISYCGAELTVPEFLSDLWPFDLPLSRFPSYCGAGEGPGDWIVPEKVRGAILSPACFIHDVDWALAPSRDPYHFVMSNVYFWQNNRALVKAQLREKSGQYIMALHLCNLYAAVVTTPLGWRSYTPIGESNWKENAEVKQKLNRLAMANLWCPATGGTIEGDRSEVA
jgi:hypothetical protein